MAKQGLTRKRLNAVFATATFGYKDGLFLDVTARNDWSSTLAFTDSYSFFYPSVGASLLLDRFVDMGSNIDLFKFRASYSIGRHHASREGSVPDARTREDPLVRGRFRRRILPAPAACERHLLQDQHQEPVLRHHHAVGHGIPPAVRERR